MKLFQQGDLLFEEIKHIPSTAKSHKGEGWQVMAHGESGHAHRIAVKDIDYVEVRKELEDLYLSVKEPTDIVHEEHKTVTLPVGDYIVRKVREYDYWADEVRSVQD